MNGTAPSAARAASRRRRRLPRACQHTQEAADTGGQHAASATAAGWTRQQHAAMLGSPKARCDAGGRGAGSRVQAGGGARRFELVRAHGERGRLPRPSKKPSVIKRGPERMSLEERSAHRTTRIESRGVGACSQGLGMAGVLQACKRTRRSVARMCAHVNNHEYAHGSAARRAAPTGVGDGVQAALIGRAHRGPPPEWSPIAAVRRANFALERGRHFSRWNVAEEEGSGGHTALTYPWMLP